MSNNLEEGMPIQPLSWVEAISEDSIKYIIKISAIEDKLTLSTSYKKGLLCKQYFSSHDLSKIQENKNFSFKNIHDYIVFLKDNLEINKLRKLENKIKNVNGGLSLEIPVKLGPIKEIKFDINEKELTGERKQWKQWKQRRTDQEQQQKQRWKDSKGYSREDGQSE